MRAPSPGPDLDDEVARAWARPAPRSGPPPLSSRRKCWPRARVLPAARPAGAGRTAVPRARSAAGSSRRRTRAVAGRRGGGAVDLAHAGAPSPRAVPELSIT